MLGELLGIYPHVRSVSVAKNQLKSLQEGSDGASEVVKDLPYLLMLNASQNQIEKLDICDDPNKLTYLQILTVAQNQLKELPELLLPSVYSLNLSNNQIVSAAKFTGHATLRILDLRKNKLVNFIGFKNMPALEELYAPENELMSLEGLEGVPALKRLHIRKNPVRFPHSRL